MPPLWGQEVEGDTIRLIDVESEMSAKASQFRKEGSEIYKENFAEQEAD